MSRFRGRGLTGGYQCSDVNTLKGILKCLDELNGRRNGPDAYLKKIVEDFIEQDDDFIRNTVYVRSVDRLFRDCKDVSSNRDRINYLKIIEHLLDLDIIGPNQVYQPQGWETELNPITTPFSSFLWIEPVSKKNSKYNKLTMRIFHKFIEKGGLFVLTKDDVNSPYFQSEEYWGGFYRHGLDGFLTKYPKNVINEFLENGSIKLEWLRFFDNSDKFYSAVASAVRNKDLGVLDVVLDHGAECSPRDRGLMDSIYDQYLFHFIEENTEDLTSGKSTKLANPENLKVLEHFISRCKNVSLISARRINSINRAGPEMILAYLTDYISNLTPRSLYDLSLGSIYSNRVDVSALPPTLVQPFTFDLVDLHTYLTEPEKIQQISEGIF